MTATIKSLAGTTSGLCVEYREILTPNFSQRFWHGNRVQPTLIVVHTAECAEVSSAADSLAKWGAGKDRPRASWHFAIADADITCSVDPEMAAWHAGTVNGYSIGIEHSGRASQTAEQWADEYSTNQLNLSAMLVAVLCEVYQIPVDILTPAEIAALHNSGRQPRGICGHWDITKSLGGTHTDPGKFFPWDSYRAKIKRLATGAPLT